ncbi:hypothetical protein [Pseudoalteromonas luteoviolacea]|uniref:Uncharacterized protein n=1 Tax=Pseudoalteromonas luteoviolacea DSM 6061 TaxID=1365250 RepID=A0A166UB25_9GAMM|nr:hypothetical protein [Pseudoalteromonas luteoviolacea]KZN29752.1 hypothetical protein N475_05495 [Pseudoalteromonas luteoviolacea DSM 6061]KZN55137.1 hypothetical protein N474_16840 [Pseudoalteromonas luteoviolacea CPMOR-2]MBE0389351.1 hypothetical protein [Pseudoalteromonas luteoviolacea DSM 6061]TQF67962.1 hypothetical protein FLM44_22575 [Pseudoalteromonas luteoviolacea]
MKLNLRMTGKALGSSAKNKAAKLITATFAKYVANIRKVKVHIDDVPSKLHGTLTQCRIEVLLPGLPSIMVKARGKNMAQAIKRAVTNSETVLAQKL